MSFKKCLALIISGFFIGVFACRNIGIGLCISVPFFIFVFISAKSLKISFFVLCAFIFGILRFCISYDDTYGIAFFNDVKQQITLYGVISEEPDIRSSMIKIIVSVDRIEAGDYKSSVFGKILINLPRYPEYEYGDMLKISGNLSSPKNYDKFSYKDYLARYDVYSVVQDPSVYVISKGNGNAFYNFIYKFKKDFSARLNEIFSEPSASFLSGLLLGSRKGIPEYIMNDFNTAGLTHIIAISGYNITLVIVVVTFLFGFLNRKLQIISASFVVIVFTILVGASAACVRASLMGIIGLFALFCGRKNDIDLILLFAAFFMVFWNPKVLIFDAGFQLSFLATFGLVYISPLLIESRIVKILPKFLGVRESFIMTISAQATTLPIILYNFQRLSLVAPIANIVILPFIPLSMFFGFFAVSLSYVFSPLAYFIGYIARIFLMAVTKMAHFFASMPFASFEITWFSYFLLFLYLLLLALIIVRMKVFS